MICYFLLKNNNELVSEQIFYLVYCTGDRKLGVIENAAYSIQAASQMAKSPCFHSRPRKRGIYGKGEIVCGKEIYLDTGSLFSIHIYGKN